MVLPGLEVYSFVTTCHVASSLATSAWQNVNSLVLRVYYHYVAMSVCMYSFVTAHVTEFISVASMGGVMRS